MASLQRVNTGTGICLETTNELRATQSTPTQSATQKHNCKDACAHPAYTAEYKHEASPRPLIKNDDKQLWISFVCRPTWGPSGVHQLHLITGLALIETGVAGSDGRYWPKASPPCDLWPTQQNNWECSEYSLKIQLRQTCKVLEKPKDRLEKSSGAKTFQKDCSIFPPLQLTGKEQQSFCMSEQSKMAAPWHG